MKIKTSTVTRSALGVMVGLAAGLLVRQRAARACSRVLWNGGNEQVFVGRTQDWTERAGSAFRMYPRGITRRGAVAENPHKWTSKYGSLVLSAYDMGTHEGVNEAGLSGHALYLADEAAFGERDPKLEGHRHHAVGAVLPGQLRHGGRSRRGAEVVCVSARAADPAERLPDPGAHFAGGQVRRLRGDRVHGAARRGSITTSGSRS